MRLVSHHVRILSSESRGQQIAEAALVLPIAFMILLGIYWFGRAFNVYSTINQAAQQGARAIVANSCATTCGNVSQPASVAASQVTQVLQASSVDPSQAQAAPVAPQSCSSSSVVCSSQTLGTTPGSIQVCTGVLLDPSATSQTLPPQSSGPAACGVSVSFTYPYRFFLPFTSLNMQPITLNANAQMRMEQ